MKGKDENALADEEKAAREAECKALVATAPICEGCNARHAGLEGQWDYERKKDASSPKLVFYATPGHCTAIIVLRSELAHVRKTMLEETAMLREKVKTLAAVIALEKEPETLRARARKIVRGAAYAIAHRI